MLMNSSEVLLAVAPAQAGVQKDLLKLDSRLRGNDRKGRFLIIDESPMFVFSEIVMGSPSAAGNAGDRCWL